MRIVVVGGGYIGFFLAKYFARRGDRVVVVEKRKPLCDKIAKEIDATVFCGDATRVEVLEDAEVDKADVLLAVTGRDSVNIRVAELAKKRFGVPLVVVRVDEAENTRKAIEAGADKVVCMDDFAEYFARVVTAKGYRYLSSFNGEAILEVDVPPDSPVIGQDAREIESRGVRLLLAVQDGRPVIPSSGYVVKADDKLIVFGRKEDLEEFLDFAFSG